MSCMLPMYWNIMYICYGCICLLWAVYRSTCLPEPEAKLELRAQLTYTGDLSLWNIYSSVYFKTLSVEIIAFKLTNTLWNPQSHQNTAGVMWSFLSKEITEIQTYSGANVYYSSTFSYELPEPAKEILSDFLPKSIQAFILGVKENPSEYLRGLGV